jgi:hypothetical protein
MLGNSLAFIQAVKQNSQMIHQFYSKLYTQDKSKMYVSTKNVYTNFMEAWNYE